MIYLNRIISLKALIETSKLGISLISEPEMVEVGYKRPVENPSGAADRKQLGSSCE